MPTAQGDELFDFTKSTTTASGLSYIDVVVGTGDAPRPDRLVAVHYTGMLAEDGSVFDSTDGGQPISFSLARVVPRGLAEGIETMKEGGQRVLYIPADLAYGSEPPTGSGIPPGADLIFEVELVSTK
jgi:FKBP-type peptidyl-prolyl cis-trans isomerase